MRTSRENYAKAARAGAIALAALPRGAGAAELLRSVASKFEQAPKLESPKASMGEWASMREEITRKALQAIQDSSARRDAGQITDRDLWFAIDALFDVTHGLIDPDMSALIYRARQELKEHAPQ